VTGTFKAKVSAHKGTSDRRIGVVNPARHIVENFVVYFSKDGLEI
jgi:hypothetical protein